MKDIRIKFRIKAPSIFKQNERLKSLKSKAVMALFMLFAGLVILFIASIERSPTRGLLQEGDVSVQDIYAPFDFVYDGPVDEEKTGAAQQIAASGITDVYLLSMNPLSVAKANLNVFMDNILIIKNSDIPQDEESFNAIKDVFNIQISFEQFKQIVSFENTDAIRQIFNSAMARVLSEPVIPDDEKKELIQKKINTITVKKESDRSREQVNVKDLTDLSASNKVLKEFVNKNLDAPYPLKKIIVNIAYTQIKPNVKFSKAETEAAKKAAIAQVVPFYKSVAVKKGEIIVRKGQRVDSEVLNKLSRINSLQKRVDTYGFFLNFSIIYILLIFLIVVHIRSFQPKTLKDKKGLIIIGILLILISAIAKAIIHSPLPSYFIPAACVSILYILLIGDTAVLPLIVTSSVIISLLAGAKLGIFIIAFMGSMVGAYAVRMARHRIHLIRAGLYSGMTNFICISSLGILNDLAPEVYLKEGLWGIGGGVFAAAIAMVCLPAFERTFKITTDIGLLELSDLNHPLLKDMANRAPGTYHHSLIVGNLAEAACAAIDANPLLARVGAYFHDIGKTAKAEYFAENLPKGNKAHEKLTPSMSSLLITNHVKDAVDLARKYKLGQAVIDIIEQHHGTGLVYYFYQRALEKLEDENRIKEEGFRYPGPKPQTKEPAVVLLADSVEAASRTMSDPTPAKLEELVRRIINNKFVDRQLDECDLTLKEINIIAKSFVRVLAGIYHARVEYPDNEQLEKRNKNNKNRNRKVGQA